MIEQMIFIKWNGLLINVTLELTVIKIEVETNRTRDIVINMYICV